MRMHQALELMSAFAERTGLSSDRPARRYLWTDAFAVCNYLGLARSTGEPGYRSLAERLVGQVHHTLGRHRPDDARSGWISGLDEAEGEAHPTRGGLRIGKPLPERRAGEPFDERLEWDRDGQYFHYLTKWMHALDLMSRSSGDPVYNLWARELAAAAQSAFTYVPEGGDRPRMVWKMSIDLERPLVPSMGHHDPLDGYVSVLQLRATAAQLLSAPPEPRLDVALEVFTSMIRGRDWTTSDPLGLGGLLIDAFRLEQMLRAKGAVSAQREAPASDRELLDDLLSSALAGLRRYEAEEPLELPADRRLAFRELGLAIGLRAAEWMQEAAAAGSAPLALGASARQRLDALARHRPLGERIVAFWSQARNRRADSWTEHRDINEVMLATALVPEGCLMLPVVDGARR